MRQESSIRMNWIKRRGLSDALGALTQRLPPAQTCRASPRTAGGRYGKLRAMIDQINLFDVENAW
jgi:hypothetical protein